MIGKVLLSLRTQEMMLTGFILMDSISLILLAIEQ